MAKEQEIIELEIVKELKKEYEFKTSPKDFLIYLNYLLTFQMGFCFFIHFFF